MTKPNLIDWIERTIVLPREVSAEPGPLRLWPFHRGIVQAIGDPKVERVTLIKPVRVGFSTLLHSALAYHVAADPAPILLVLPTIADCRRVMVGELEPIFDHSPALAGKLPAPKLGDRTGKFRSTILHRLYEGGSLLVVAARSPRTLRGPTARIVLADEVDGMKMTDEGHPVDLAVDRSFSFANRKIIVGSTPGDDSTSIVAPLYEQSDKRVFEVPCPACGAFSEILWPQIEWREGRPDTAAWRCPGCAELIEERHKRAMVKRGRWRATAPEVEGHAGFRLNALVSPLANAAWGRLAADFLARKDDPERLKTFVNRFLGQTWRDAADEMDELELGARAEDIGLEKLPDACLALTAGVDVQHDRLEVVILGHGRAETFVLSYQAVWTPPDSDACWRELDHLLRRTFAHPRGGRLPIEAAAVDAGDGATMDAVLAFCGPRAARKVMAVKGAPGNRPVLVPSRTKRGGKLWIVGVDGLKAQIFNRITRPALWRFSADLEPRFYEELASERRVVRLSRGRPTHQWVRIPGKQAEALDATVYALAAWASCHRDFDRRETEASTAPAIAERRRPEPVVRSRWMERA